MAVTVRYFAGARAASGVDTETREAGSLDELVGQLVDAHGAKLERVLTAPSFRSSAAGKGREDVDHRTG